VASARCSARKIGHYSDDHQHDDHRRDYQRKRESAVSVPGGRRGAATGMEIDAEPFGCGFGLRFLEIGQHAS